LYGKARIWRRGVGVKSRKYRAYEKRKKHCQ
jgi:hypothetical protein